jgi:hypothetical protein
LARRLPDWGHEAAGGGQIVANAVGTMLKLISWISCRIRVLFEIQGKMTDGQLLVLRTVSERIGA